jgi:hypothetical protein
VRLAQFSNPDAVPNYIRQQIAIDPLFRAVLIEVPK